MWIKICGIRDIETAKQVAPLAPHAIGLNFYEKTPRCVTVETAAAIVEQLPDHVQPVGLFVNHSVSTIVEICTRCQINTVQLHGDETPEFLAQLSAEESRLKIIRAYRVGGEGLDPLGRYLDECRLLKVSITACLVDARTEQAYGGTGKTVPWDMLQKEYQSDWPRLILAGGLNAENIADAIRIVRPWGVDVASGVESTAAVKDLEKVNKFIQSARNAFDEIGQSTSLQL